jgi:NADH-quinone oxidoreductase subunit L
MGVPFITSGFWSKEAILGLGFEYNRPLFWIGVATAMLTAFYMTRMFVVAFFGKPRTENAHHAVEAPIVMVLPLIVLAFLTLGSVPLAGLLEAMKPQHAETHPTVMIASIVALVIGLGAGFVIYRGKDKDPLSIKLFANKFYFDEIYAVIVNVFQDRLAWLINGIERVFVDGIVARLPAFIANRIGSAARVLTGGHLQAYTFLLGAGVLMVIYLVVFVLPQLGH